MGLLAKRFVAQKFTATSEGGFAPGDNVKSVNNISPDGVGNVALGDIVHSVDNRAPNQEGNVAISQGNTTQVFTSVSSLLAYLTSLPEFITGVLDLQVQAGAAVPTSAFYMDCRVDGYGVISISFNGMDFTSGVGVVAIMLGTVPVILRDFKTNSIADDSVAVEVERKLVLDNVVFASRPTDYALPNTPNLDITFLDTCDMSAVSGSLGGLFTVAEGGDYMVHIESTKFPVVSPFNVDASPFCTGSGTITFSKLVESTYPMSEFVDPLKSYVKMFGGRVSLKDGTTYGEKTAVAGPITYTGGNIQTMQATIDSLPYYMRGIVYVSFTGGQAETSTLTIDKDVDALNINFGGIQVSENLTIQVGNKTNLTISNFNVSTTDTAITTGCLTINRTDASGNGMGGTVRILSGTTTKFERLDVDACTVYIDSGVDVSGSKWSKISCNNGARVYSNALNYPGPSGSRAYVNLNKGSTCVLNQGVLMPEGNISCDASSYLSVGGVLLRPTANVVAPTPTDITIECANVQELLDQIALLPLKIDNNYTFHIGDPQQIVADNADIVINGYKRGGMGSIKIIADNYVFVNNITIYAAVPVSMTKVNPHMELQTSTNRLTIKPFDGEVPYPVSVYLYSILTFPTTQISLYDHHCYHFVNIFGAQTVCCFEYVDITTLGTLAENVQGPIMRIGVDAATLNIKQSHDMMTRNIVQTTLTSTNGGTISINRRNSLDNTVRSIKTGGRMFIGRVGSPTTLVVEDVNP